MYVNMLMEYHFSMEGTYTSEGPFLSKMVYKRVWGWTSGLKLPV